MAMLSKDAILSRAERLTKEEPSEFFGGSLLLRELSRPDYLTAGKAAQGSDELWWAAVFAAGVVHQVVDDGVPSLEPMFGIDEVIAFKHDTALWTEIVRIVAAILHLSEVGADALTKSGPPAHTGRGQGRRGRVGNKRGSAPGA